MLVKSNTIIFKRDELMKHKAEKLLQYSELSVI